MPARRFEPTVKTVDLARCLVAPGFYFGDRYDRFQEPVILTGTTARLTVTTRNIADGGARIPFGFALPLTLTFDGRAVAAATTVAEASSVSFDVNLANLSGWFRTSVTGAPADWSVLDYAVFIDKGQASTMMPVVIGSYALVHPFPKTPYVHQFAMVPAAFRPREQPLPQRECPSFSDLPARDKLVMTQLAICRQDDKHRPVRKGRVLCTANRQDYFWSDVTEKRPWFHMLDGPRGRGTVVCPTHLEVGTAAPPSVGFVGNTYFCEPQRFGKVSASGEVVTLAGYRHNAPPTHWSDAQQDVQLVGDWSSIPADRRGFRELWGMAWDRRTFAIDEGAQPIPAERNLKPHVKGATAFLTDMLNNRVIKLEFAPTSHLPPPKVTEYLTAAEPWDLVFVEPNLLYVSERKSHRIVGYDIDTRKAVRTLQAAEPSGLYFLDGWLYYGSLAKKSVRKVNLATGQDIVAVDLTPFVDDNSKYVKLAVSDGTFGPRGMLGVVTWSNIGYGYPNLFRPDGKEIDGWLWAGNARLGPMWPGQGDPAPGYATAVAFGFGRMLCGTVHEGLMQLSKALPTDRPLPADYAEGLKQWYTRGYQLTDGHRGFGLYGQALPWGVSPEIDVFLTANGHVRL